MVDSPGTSFRYSNFGYRVLGRVIEAVTGSAYADHVRSAILSPSGVTNMTVAGDTAAQRQPHEVMYRKSGHRW